MIQWTYLGTAIIFGAVNTSNFSPVHSLQDYEVFDASLQ